MIARPREGLVGQEEGIVVEGVGPTLEEGGQPTVQDGAAAGIRIRPAVPQAENLQINKKRLKSEAEFMSVQFS